MVSVPETLRSTMTDAALLPFDPGGLEPSDAVLAWCERAKDALDEARSLTETTQALTMVSVVADVTKRIEVSREASVAASEVRLRWERRLGEVIAAEREAGRLAGEGRPRKAETIRTADSFAPTLRDVGISLNQSADAQRLAAVPQEEFDAAVESVKASGAANVTKPAVLRAVNPDAERSDVDWWIEADKFTDACKRVMDRSDLALRAARFGKYPARDALLQSAVLARLVGARDSIDEVIREIERRNV
jgi:hypothetical protein